MSSFFQHFWAIMELFVLINFSRTPGRWNLQGNVLRLLQWTWRAGRFASLFLSSLGKKKHHQGVGWECGGNEVDFSSKRDALLVNLNTSGRTRPIEEEEGIMCFRKLPLFTPANDCEFGSNHLASWRQIYSMLGCWVVKKLRCRNGRRNGPLLCSRAHNTSQIPYYDARKPWGIFSVACFRVESPCFS